MKNTATVLVVDDDAAFRLILSGELERLGYQVVAVATGESALKEVIRLNPDVVLLDLRLPGLNGLEVMKRIREINPASEVIMLTGHGSIDTAIESIRIGAFDYVVKPCPLDELQIRIQRALERRSLTQRANLLERGLTPPDLANSFLGQSPEFRSLLQLIERIAASDSTVLITGETGSGKERVAKLLHGRSSRKNRPFVVVDCASLQESLLQSELFGHERGAFTGADRPKPGLFEVAHGGTIFLDEIGEVSPATQVKLLRVLDTSTFRRVGGTAELRVDVRVLAATNQDLPEMVRKGLFRQDLFYRLNTFRVEIPPLRKRTADVDLLAQHFAKEASERFGMPKQISEGALEALRRHTWPGNVRELRHAIEAAAVVCEGSEILAGHLPASVRTHHTAGASDGPAGAGRAETLIDLERAHIKTVLESTAGHRANAAKILGISERNLYRKLREHGLLG
jgi:DNA-binding NtrC family response regulator